MIKINFNLKKDYNLLSLTVAKPQLIAGMKHIEAAIWHATKQYENNEMISDTLDIEILLYLCGERQISKALKKIGLPKYPKEAIVIVVGQTIPNEFTNILEANLNIRINNQLLTITKDKKSSIKKHLLHKTRDNDFNLQEILSMMANLALEK